MRRKTVHYASSYFVKVAILGAVTAGTGAFLGLPEGALGFFSRLVPHLWIVLGPIAAFAIQLCLQLMAVGEDKALTASEQAALANIVDERLRYLWDLTGVAVVALLLGIAAGATNEGSSIVRPLLSFALGLAALTGLLAARLPTLFGEIREFKWRLARERNEAELRKNALAAIEAASKEAEREVPEPKRANGGP